MAKENSGAGRVPAFLKKKPVGAALAVLCALLLTVLFGSGLSRTSAAQARPLDLASATGEGFTHTAEGLVIAPEGGRLVFSGLDAPSASLRLDYHAPEAGQYGFPVQAQLTLSGDGGTAEAAFLADKAVLAPRQKPAHQNFLLRSAGDLKSFEITLTPGQAAWVLTGVTLNGGGFAFNWGLFALLALLCLGVWAVFAFGLHRHTYKDENPRHRWLARGVTGLCCLVLVAVFVLCAPAGRPGLVWNYDPDLAVDAQPDDWPGTAQYHILFDALWHGQTALRLAPDARLAELDNPYDRSQRGDIPVLWDASYYNGHYYTYFAPGPVVLYFGVYLVTGRLPSQALACLVPALLAAGLLWAALRRLLLTFKIRPNLLLLLLSIPAVVFGSLTAMLLACADAYVQPYLWAGAALCGMVWLLYSAVEDKNTLRRRLRYIGAGLCVGMAAASRPAVALVCLAFAAPVLLGMLRRPGKAGAKVLDIAALGLPVLAAAGLLMAYNAARFGSPFEFGQAYQLTVGDMRYTQLRAAPVWLLDTLRYYLFQPLHLSQTFPFVEMQKEIVFLSGGRFYTDPFFGLMNLPLFWGLFALPLALRNSTAAKKAVFIGVLAAGAVCWWVDFSIANFLYRYLCDAGFAFALLAAVIWLQLCGGQPEGQPGLEKAAALEAGGTVALHRQNARLAAACLACVITIGLGLLLAFATDRNTLYLNHPAWYTALSNMLRLT